MTEIVSIVKVEGGLHKSIEKTLNLVNWEKRLKGTNVVIKPNLCDVKFIRGAVTNPQVIGCLVRILRDKISQVLVGESDGYFYSADEAFKNIGLREIVEKAGGKIVNFSKDKRVKVECKDALFLGKVELPRTLMDADVLINVPVLKTHEVTNYTGAIKNLFGCHPSNRRILLHPHLDEVLVDLVRILRKQIVLMDATTGMEGNAPAKGVPVEMNLLLASLNPVAIDMVATHLIGIDKACVGHLRLAERILGYDDKRLEVIGESIERVARPFLMPYRDPVVNGQLFVNRNYLLTYLCFNTPLFNILKIGAKIQRLSYKIFMGEEYKTHRTRL